VLKYYPKINAREWHYAATKAAAQSNPNYRRKPRPFPPPAISEYLFNKTLAISATPQETAVFTALLAFTLYSALCTLYYFFPLRMFPSSTTTTLRFSACCGKQPKHPPKISLFAPFFADHFCHSGNP
jgi:hypothetical protein